MKNPPGARAAAARAVATRRTDSSRLNAFAWALGFVGSLHFDSCCDDSLITCFPDLKNDGSSDDYKAHAKTRSIDQIVSACDLAYCLHWAVADANLRSKPIPGHVDAHIIVERRRALEWMLSSDDWDDVSLDT